ncbi:MAG: GWxTD domain-containing protein [Saprospiraceae bacterium]|nr:GWxTD domain-containing protein [Saprospiraceae bacterium]
MNNSKCILFCIVFTFLSLNLFSLEVSVSTSIYKNNSNPYIEIYNRINAESVQWISQKVDSSLIISNLEYLVLISKDDQIVVAEKYNIQSPSLEEQVDYWDMKRFAIEDGLYNLKLQFIDLNNPLDTFNFDKEIEVNFSKTKVSNSSLLFLTEVGTLETSLPFQKASFKFEPLAYNLLDHNIETLIFYTEIYDAELSFDDTYFIKYFVENLDKSGFEAYSKTGYKKIEPKAFEPLLIEFDVSELKSGNYKLHFEINKKDRSLVSSDFAHFAIYNPVEDYRQNFKGDKAFETSFVHMLDGDELNYGLKAIFPRVGNLRSDLINQIIRNEDLLPKRYFLYNFWSSFSTDNMKKIYEQYMTVAKAVDITYANNVGHGFETHRGYYFLKYGKPDDVIFVEDEPTAPPYEIWIYNYLAETQQTNVRFLFYNPSLVTNDFILLHSTCRGERNNPRWELELYSDAYQDQPNNFIDSRNMPDGFNRNARKIFDDY